MEKILQDMITVLERIDAYGERVIELRRQVQAHPGEDAAPAGAAATLVAGRPQDLSLDLPTSTEAERVREASSEAQKASGRRGLAAVPGKRKTPFPRIL